MIGHINNILTGFLDLLDLTTPLTTLTFRMVMLLTQYTLTHLA
ncbi:hypothetical protein PTE_00327 [Photorhabdus khanii NC19]|uniref:Uncharacterized protein n=1 Tax=Photorhabdus khanii NC19 TaxID=1004151 RepID=W3VDK3_9GAMM|nr:hypothetical protein PTE_00327 [Photorhabdus khanii NC19]